MSWVRAAHRFFAVWELLLAALAVALSLAGFLYGLRERWWQMPEDPKTMEDSPKWEMVVETIKGQDYTQRLKIDAGYLYKHTQIAGATTGASGQVAVALAFVPYTGAL